jgi:hypothetical protein
MTPLGNPSTDRNWQIAFHFGMVMAIVSVFIVVSSAAFTRIVVHSSSPR